MLHDAHNRIRYFQLMDAIVTHVVLDRRGISDGLDQKIGVSVNQLVSKLVDQDRLNVALEDVKQARQELEMVTKQKNQLELEIGQKDGTSETLQTRRADVQTLLFRKLTSRALTLPVK